MKVNVALVGLGFGADFVPIYLHHPDVESLVICDSDEIDAVTAANWTAAGICAHESAIRDGERVYIPAFE